MNWEQVRELLRSKVKPNDAPIDDCRPTIAEVIWRAGEISGRDHLSHRSPFKYALGFGGSKKSEPRVNTFLLLVKALDAKLIVRFEDGEEVEL